jgi:rare lipoprotein A
MTRLLLACGAAALAIGCLAREPALAADAAKDQTGIASIYSTDSGSQTASGQRLNPKALTAAHRTLPFGTKVRVTNRKNGRSVVVTINDRGPFIRGRVIDLTPAGARELGFSGLTQVALAIEEPAPPKPAKVQQRKQQQRSAARKAEQKLSAL